MMQEKAAIPIFAGWFWMTAPLLCAIIASANRPWWYPHESRVTQHATIIIITSVTRFLNGVEPYTVAILTGKRR